MIGCDVLKASATREYRFSILYYYYFVSQDQNAGGPLKQTGHWQGSIVERVILWPLLLQPDIIQITEANAVLRICVTEMSENKKQSV